MKRIALAVALVAMAGAGAACQRTDQARTADTAADTTKMMMDSTHRMSDTTKMSDTVKTKP